MVLTRRGTASYFLTSAAAVGQTVRQAEANTTAHMIQDINAIADYFGLQKFALRGTSWGSCLARPMRWSTGAGGGTFVGGIFTASQKKLTG